jgi:hypothetical protein
LTIHQITSIPEGTSSSSFAQNVGEFLTNALDPFQLRDQHLMMEVAADINQGSVALEDATRIVMRAIDPVSDQLRGWYSAGNLKTVETCYTLVRQYEAAAVDREGEQLLETLERLGERVGAAGVEHAMHYMPAVKKLDLQGDLAMVAAELRDGPITKERAGYIVDQALHSFDPVGTLDKRHLEALAICLLVTDDGDLNNIFSVEEPDTRQDPQIIATDLDHFIREKPLAKLEKTMTDAGVDFLAVASRVAQGRYPLLGGEISNLDLEEREGWLDAIFDGIVQASSINNQYDAARLLMNAHSLTDSRVPRIERYLNSIFTQTDEIRPEVQEELGDILEGASLLDQALMMMRLRGEVRLSAEYLCDMVTGYDYALRTEARFEQPGRININVTHRTIMEQFEAFCDSEIAQNLSPNGLVHHVGHAFSEDVSEMLRNLDAEFYNPISAEFIGAFKKWRKDAQNSWEISDEEYNNLVSALIADFANGSGHPKALFDRYITARDFIREETSVPSSEDQVETKVSVHMLLLKELELCVVSGWIEALWTEELEKLKEPLAALQQEIINANNNGNPNSQFFVATQSIQMGINQFWNRFGENVENLAERCILNEAELLGIMTERYTPIFSQDINGFLATLYKDNDSNDDQ